MTFRYEALKVWPLALEYTDACFAIADNLPQSVPFSIGEQLRRSATSLIANIAEGSGKTTGRSERNFYDIARGSVAETVGLLALLHLEVMPNKMNAMRTRRDEDATRTQRDEDATRTRRDEAPPHIRASRILPSAHPASTHPPICASRIRN